MLKIVLKYVLIVVVAAGLAAANTATAQTSDLVNLLVSKLGVTSEQATGGAGAIFDLAKQNLAPDQFAQVAKAVPGMDTLLSAAPAAEAPATESAEAAGGAASTTEDPTKMVTAAGKSSEGSTDMGSMKGMMTKEAGGAAGMPSGTAGMAEGASGMMGKPGSLGGAFEQLGMSPDMVQKFVPVVLDYVNSQGGPAVMQILQGALI